jgi:hypothetical protein
MPLDRECFLLIRVPALIQLLVLYSSSSSSSSSSLVRLAALALLQDVVFILPERNRVVYVAPVLYST